MNERESLTVIPNHANLANDNILDSGSITIEFLLFHLILSSILGTNLLDHAHMHSETVLTARMKNSNSDINLMVTPVSLEASRVHEIFESGLP